MENSALETQVISNSTLQDLIRAANAATDESKDLGFGAISAGKTRRLLNRDGTFNAQREGYSILHSQTLYHYALQLSWPSFFLHISGLYFFVNILFAFFYLACGTDALNGVRSSGLGGRLLECFFFSVQTMATVGYGQLTPNTLPANFIATAEILVGLLGFAIATGLLFARFSRPTARINFSKNAIMAPYRDGRAFEFRLVNARRNQLFDLTVRVVMSRFEFENGGVKRKFYDLDVERRQIMFFPLNWTVVHPITPESPLWGINADDLARSDAEFLILLTGIDDTFSQTVYSWSSYKFDEVQWGARFTNILSEHSTGMVQIDMNRIDEFEPVGLPSWESLKRTLQKSPPATANQGV